MSWCTYWFTTEMEKSHRKHLQEIIYVHWYNVKGTKELTKIFFDSLISFIPLFSLILFIVTMCGEEFIRQCWMMSSCKTDWCPYPTSISIWRVYLCINAWMGVSLTYLMIFTPITEIYMVVIHAKRVIYMPHMEGFTLGKTAWQYMKQACKTQFQKMLKCQSLYTYSNRDCIILY